MNKKTWWLYGGVLLLLIGAGQGCSSHYFRSNYHDVNSLVHQMNKETIRPFMKAHLKNGDVIIFRNSWQVDTTRNQISGYGLQYDFNRRPVFEGQTAVPIDSVAVFETNRKLPNPEAGRVAALSILTGVDLLVGVICITNPKACYGSCPTFYLNEDDNFHYADAEGFSNAILPSMEYADVDALNNTPIGGNSFSLTMKNEALETHCIKSVKLLACPRKPGERIFQSPANDFYRCENTYSLSRARAAEGDITSLLQREDRQERFSLSDENNLESKEEILLDFEPVTDPEALGLVLSFRQTLMTTYLFYSAMGYMGDEVGDMFAKLETDADLRKKFDATTKLLGGIAVYSWNEKSNTWQYENTFNETGPIAANRQVIPLKNTGTGARIKLKLVLNRGFWRIDYLALTNIKAQVKPLEIQPAGILNKGKPDNAALKQLTATDQYLISMPGSEYKLNFNLPAENADYELFLSSQGYYLEWMRQHWLKDKDLLKLRQMVYNPKKFLKEEATQYKQYETTMEQQFWNSRIDTRTFSYQDR